MKNAIGYIRVSTEGQIGEDKYGVDAQKQAIAEYAKENNYEVLEYKVESVSGVSDDRPIFNEILNNSFNPPIEAVIVFKNDRIARDTKLYFYYLYTLEKKNIKLISTRESFDEGSDFANIYRSLMLFVAEMERKNIALRTGRGRSIKSECGGYSGGRCPYGYKVENGVLKVREDEREMIRFIFRERSEGKTYMAICDDLREAGYKPRKGSSFLPPQVQNILKNEKLYRGYYKYGKMEKYVPGVQEPILSEEEYKIK